MRSVISALLALAIASGMALFAAEAADSGAALSAADSGYRLMVLKAQTLTEGTAFDPDTAPEATSVRYGDIVVLTLGFRNDSGAAVSVTGFSVKLRYDKAKVSPYTGAAPFAKNPYQVFAELTGDYGWSAAGNGEGDGFISVSGGGSVKYSVKSGSALVLCRMAFRANADGVAPFVLDPDSAKTRVIGSDRKAFSLAALQPFDLTVSFPYSVSVDRIMTDRLIASLRAPQGVTVAASFFDANGRFLTFRTAAVGSSPQLTMFLPELPANATVNVALVDSDWRPLACCDAKIP